MADVILISEKYYELYLHYCLYLYGTNILNKAYSKFVL